MWTQVVGGFGVVLGVSLAVVGVMTANPVAVYYGGELAVVGAIALMSGASMETIGPGY